MALGREQLRERYLGGLVGWVAREFCQTGAGVGMALCRNATAQQTFERRLIMRVEGKGSGEVVVGGTVAVSLDEHPTAIPPLGGGRSVNRGGNRRRLCAGAEFSEKRGVILC